MQTLRENQMSEFDIDMDRAMQGIYCEAITWTKCSERMPPDDGEPIIIEFYSILSQMVYIVIFDATLKYAYFRSLKRRLNSVNWAPYTPEAWAELNKK